MTKENNNYNDIIQTNQERLDTILQSVQSLVNQGETEFSNLLGELSLVVREINTEIEQLVTTHQELQLECQHYQELIAGTSDAYLMTDSAGVIKKANQAAADLLKINNPNSLAGKPLSCLISEANLTSFNEEIKELKFLFNKETQIKLANEQFLPAKISLNCICDRQENVIALSWLIRPIEDDNQNLTNRAESEKEKELSELKTRLIQTVSHEFRTPLNMIHISAQLLEKYYHTFSREKSKRFFHKTRTAIKYITELLDDVLVYSQAESGKLQLTNKLLDLNQFTAKLIEEQQLLRGSKYRINFGSNCQSISVCVDEKLLHQIFGNLLSNAIKYSPQGGNIDVELNCIADRVIFEVSDRGIGIPAEEIPYLFEPFHRAKNAGTIPGTGLGLAIVKKAVEALSGEITLESEINVGTTLTVSLPILSENIESECRRDTELEIGDRELGDND
ncbi:sensor histidine kinase [Oscillatoria salina]|uniref:sensor histidine kinase n=1 Tax=Oscillatoria salina TaxID=331517 RepID=UPI0013B879B2|nr:ATP-binding protein [Oscillatoria salina]MBZ8181500.1 PAS domain-containing protein [Oscillatoria salina IIICB1]NET90439.1 PAS domain-containing protein [Kamptonema sp. SIO1D9]